MLVFWRVFHPHPWKLMIHNLYHKPSGFQNCAKNWWCNQKAEPLRDTDGLVSLEHSREWAQIKGNFGGDMNKNICKTLIWPWHHPKDTPGHMSTNMELVDLLHMSARTTFLCDAWGWWKNAQHFPRQAFLEAVPPLPSRPVTTCAIALTISSTFTYWLLLEMLPPPRNSHHQGLYIFSSKFPPKKP